MQSGSGRNTLTVMLLALWCSGRAAGWPPVCPVDLGTQGGNPGADGILNNNDFVVFIDLFFNGC